MWSRQKKRSLFEHLQQLLTIGLPELCDVLLDRGFNGRDVSLKVQYLDEKGERIALSWTRGRML